MFLKKQSGNKYIPKSIENKYLLPWQSAPQWQIYRRKVNLECCISKFAINEWYFRGTYFVDIFCHCLFLSHTVYVIFIMKKIFHNVVHTSHQARLYHFFIVEIIVEVVNFTYIYKNKMKKQLPWWRTKII